MKKLLNAALSVNFLRKTIGFNTIMNAMCENLKLDIINNPQKLLPKNHDKLKILVLSPHPDDDVFGCGGTIIKHIKNGDKVNILYFCDGSHGTKGGKRDLSLIKTRQQETKKSVQIMGVNNDNLVFWNNEDGKLTDNKTTVDKLSELIKKIKPQIIYLPSILDDNSDHRAVNKIFYKTFCVDSGQARMTGGDCFANTRNDDKNLLIAMYEIWTPILPNRIINITNVVGIKKLSMSAHKSQLVCRDYNEAILAHNKYRATINNISGFAESFFVCSSKIYKTLFKNCPV